MKRTVKQYCYEYDDLTLQELNRIAFNYTNIKNYFYSRFSGIKNYDKLFNYKKDIRDNLVSDVLNNKMFFKLPARYWKQALDEVISNIKSNWSNTINKVKNNIKYRKELSAEDKKYVFYALKAKNILYSILNEVTPNYNDKLKSFNVNKEKLNKLIRRLCRKYKSNISFSKKKNGFYIDTSMYRYENNFLYIQSLIRGKRLKLKVNTAQRFNKTLKILITPNRIEIHCPIDIKEIKNNSNNIIGIDKNYENVITSSNDSIYGAGINKLSNIYTNISTENNNKKNKLSGLIKKYKKTGKTDKINNIIKNNLSNKKINKEKNKIKEHIKSKINNELNNFIKEENPKILVVENLNFQYNNKKRKIRKDTKHKLNSWFKGYLQEKIEFKSYVHDIELKKVNAAYTSQICSNCWFFLNKRVTGGIFNCPNCGKGVNVHCNSAHVVLNRLGDDEITLNTPYLMVKEILLNRNKRMQELKTDASKTPETEGGQSESELSQICNNL